MPPSCCVIGCKSRGTVPPGVVFFQLPLNKPTLLTQWLIVLDRVDWLPKPSHRICSLHFSTEDYISKPNQGGGSRLKPDAIPSVFPDLEADENNPDVSEDQKEEEEDLPKPTNKTKSSPVSTPTTELPSGRPRRISKVSSKMKDYILFDDSLKRHRGSPAGTHATPQKDSQEGGNKAAQELLSILEDSNSLSGDEKKLTSSSKTFIGSPSANLKTKPAPASVKKARQLVTAQIDDAKPKVPGVVKKAIGSPKPKGPKSDSFDLKNKVIELNSGEKVIYLSYADLNPVADMTKNNALLKKKSSSTENKSNDGNETSYNNDSDTHCPSPIPEEQTEFSVASSSPKRKIKKEKDAESDHANVMQGISDEVSDADSGMQGSRGNNSIAPSPAVAKLKRSINTPSPLKKKKRFKAVAEIVVRTDNTGEVPNVSIEKMTTLDSDTPKKKNKISSKPIPPIQNLSLPGLGEDELYSLSDRVVQTVKQMRMLENTKGNPLKLTVLVTTLPPVDHNDVIIVKKKNTVGDSDKNRELKVCVINHQDNATPVVGVSDIDPKDNNNTLIRKTATLATDNSEGEVTAPLQHDHTYISPSLKISEQDILRDDPPKELLNSKLKLSEEEIAYRNKVHKKLRLLKETVKRKNETINKLKQKVGCLEKSLRDERKAKKKMNMLGKIRQGIDSGVYEEMLDGDSRSLEYLPNTDLPMDYEEALDESEEEGRDGSRSPITYICEPAIDVCEKPVAQE